MRVLLVASPAFYGNRNQISSPYNGGGWMFTFQKALIESKEIELGITFPTMMNVPSKTVQEDAVYYPVHHHKKSLKDKIIDSIFINNPLKDKKIWGYYIKKYEWIISDFEPDIIHVFGSETYSQLITIASKSIPTIIHVQGILNSCKYVVLPPGVSSWKYIWKDYSLKKAYENYRYLKGWSDNCYREKEIFKAATHLIGRTDWDRHTLSLINPKAKYHYGAEILRPEFYLPSTRKPNPKLTIITTASDAPYKGIDIILKVASILKKEQNIDFEWKVFGNVKPDFYEKFTGEQCKDVNVNLCGVVNASQLREELLKSTLYFQSSYIENSPNSVCEAQILGVPVVATNVGGTSSLIEHGKTGFLFPATDPYLATYYVKKLFDDKQKNQNLGNNAKEIAIERHCSKKIIEKLLNTYNEILIANVAPTLEK